MKISKNTVYIDRQIRVGDKVRIKLLDEMPESEYYITDHMVFIKSKRMLPDPIHLASSIFDETGYLVNALSITVDGIIDKRNVQNNIIVVVKYSSGVEGERSLPVEVLKKI